MRELLGRTLGEFDGPVIVPMTLVNPDYYQEIVGGRLVAEVADTIAGSAGLALTPSTDGPLRAWLHRYATTVRNINWN